MLCFWIFGFRVKIVVVEFDLWIRDAVSIGIVWINLRWERCKLLMSVVAILASLWSRVQCCPSGTIQMHILQSIGTNGRVLHLQTCAIVGKKCQYVVLQAHVYHVFMYLSKVEFCVPSHWCLCMREIHLESEPEKTSSFASYVWIMMVLLHLQVLSIYSPHIRWITTIVGSLNSFVHLFGIQLYLILFQLYVFTKISSMSGCVGSHMKLTRVA